MTGNSNGHSGKLPVDSLENTYLENGQSLHPGIEQERLEYERDAHNREKNLFDYTKGILKALFIFAGACILLIIIVVGVCHASPWLVTLGTVTLVVPTFLLGCFLHHIYGKDSNTKLFPELLARTPIKDILAGIKEIVAVWKGKYT